MASHPSTEETNAMAAFLAASGEPLAVRSSLWAKVVELINARPKEVVEQMEQEKGLSK